MALTNLWLFYWDFLPGTCLFEKTGFYDTEPIHTRCIVSFCILGCVYLDKNCPGKEGHPSSRVNFRERLYQVRKKPTHLSKPIALAHTVIVPPLHPHRSFFFFSNFLFSPKETRASASELLVDPYLNQEWRVRRLTSGHVESVWTPRASI